VPLRSVLLSAGLVLTVPSAWAQSQLATLASVPGAAAAAGTFDETYRELMALGPVAERTAEVRNLVLRRDAATFTLEQGRLYQLTPIGGRTVGLVYVGKGQFAFAPASRIEQDRLERLEKVRALDVPVSAVFFLFADSTLAQLEKSLTFVPGNPPDDVRKSVKDGLKYLVDEDSHTLDPDIMGALLNRETSDLFYAHITRAGGNQLMFRLDPDEVEAVRLQTRVSRRGWGRHPEVITQFARQGAVRTGGQTGDRVRQANVRQYTIETTLNQTGIGELNFAAAATLEITADSRVGPWIAFELFDKLKVDSARWVGGEPAPFYRGKESELLWIRLNDPIGPGDVRPLQLYYHGDLIDRYVDFFMIKSSAAWYPRSLEGRSLARFDLTFNTSDAYLIASVGQRVDSSKTGHTVRTRWVTSAPIRNASFNLGLFKDYSVREDGIPPVTVMMSDAAHRKLGGGGSGMQKRVGEDMTKSLRYFQHVYGASGVNHFYATEIPGFHGEAFPGMVHLSWVTFQSTLPNGEDEVFRAHEVAHQWWGIGVDFTSYHDQWLSEGFADFSGLWYLQTVSGKNEKYFDLLRQYRASILMRNEEPGPISLGYRVFAAKDDDQDDYQTVVYKKGAWVVHMLRILTLDIATMNEDKFSGIMREFYQSYQGRRASTDDFRQVVERHVKTDMRWFFDQWVDGTAIPTYRVSSTTVAADGGQFQVKLKVKQEGVPDGFQMYVPVTLEMGKGQLFRYRVKVKGPVSEITLPAVPAKPKSVKFNDLEGVLAEVKTESWGS
jgi:hypothetical protein